MRVQIGRGCPRKSSVLTVAWTFPQLGRMLAECAKKVLDKKVSSNMFMIICR